MRILVVGAGAVGGYLGALWSDAGRDVTMLVREARRADLAASGLVVSRPGGELVAHPRLSLAGELDGHYDVILLAVPGHGLAEAAMQIVRAVGPETLIIPALNGARHFDVLREAFGDGTALGSVVKCVTTLDDGGHVLELAPGAQISFGRWDGGTDDRLDAVRQLLSCEGIEVGISTEIGVEISEKWLMMVALGSANSLLDGDVGAINADPYGRRVIQQILLEGRQALDAIDMPPRSKVVEQLSQMFAAEGSRQTSSLYRNLRAGRPIEHEPIVGDLLARVPDPRPYPLLSAAYARMAIYETARASRVETASRADCGALRRGAARPAVNKARGVWM